MFEQQKIHPFLKYAWEILFLENISNPKLIARSRADAKKYQRDDSLECRADLKATIESLQQDGKLAVYHWSRDCDQCEGDSMRLIPATVFAYSHWEERMHDQAEGPCRTEPVSFDAYNSFEASFKDRRAEQYNY